MNKKHTHAIININYSDITEEIRKAILNDNIKSIQNKYNIDELNMIRAKSRWMITNDEWRDTYNLINKIIKHKELKQ